MTLDELNKLPTKSFLEQCKSLLEHCDWVLPVLEESRPFMSALDMQNKLAVAIKNAPLGLQKQALQLHPKLGVGKAQPGFSQSEQQQAGLSSLSEDELMLFKKLNHEYENKMGYPFVVAVTGMNKTQILTLMQQRLNQTEEIEWPVSVAELIKIAQIRVKKLID
ncbi:hypothetical protein JCM30760_16930 [Thiomicrorhabdus hydrogeniphila]